MRITETIDAMMARVEARSVNDFAGKLGCDPGIIYRARLVGTPSDAALKSLQRIATRAEWTELLASAAYRRLDGLGLSHRARLRCARAVAEEAAEIDFDRPGNDNANAR